MAQLGQVIAPPAAIYVPLRRWVDEFAGKVRAGVTAYQRETGNGVSPTSWWRSSAHNASVGGAPGSQHQLGLAIDLVPIAPDQAAQRVLLWRALSRAGLVAIVESDHVHAQNASAGIWDAVIAEAKRRRLI